MKGIIFAIAFFGAGLALDVYSGDHLWLATSSTGWPTADGTIGASEIETTRARRSASYAAHVTYTYSVDGKPLGGSQITFGNEGLGDRSVAMAIVERFPRGSEVKVHYQPGNPANAVLIVGLETWRDLIPLAIGLGITGVGGYALLQTLRDRARKKKTPPRKAFRT
jgi:hypothetical protein